MGCSMTSKPANWTPDCLHTASMVVKRVKKRGGVEYICDLDRRGCGKVVPGARRKKKVKP